MVDFYVNNYRYTTQQKLSIWTSMNKKTAKSKIRTAKTSMPKQEAQPKQRPSTLHRAAVKESCLHTLRGRDSNQRLNMHHLTCSHSIDDPWQCDTPPSSGRSSSAAPWIHQSHRQEALVTIQLTVKPWSVLHTSVFPRCQAVSAHFFRPKRSKAKYTVYCTDGTTDYTVTTVMYVFLCIAAKFISFPPHDKFRLNLVGSFFFSILLKFSVYISNSVGVVLSTYS